jgi:hypothetical protein
MRVNGERETRETSYRVIGAVTRLRKSELTEIRGEETPDWAASSSRAIQATNSTLDVRLSGCPSPFGALAMLVEGARS